MDESKYRALFIKETSAHIEGLEKNLLKLETNPDPRLIDELFRHYHSIKGMSASMGYEPLKHLAHDQEDLLSVYRETGSLPCENVITVLLNCLDLTKEMLSLIKEDRAIDTDISGALAMLKKAKEEPHAREKTTLAETVELKVSRLMRVDHKVFDDLLKITGDLFMAHVALKTLPHAAHSLKLKDNIHMSGRALDSLYSKILEARMLGFDSLTQGMPRVVRDLSKKAGKDVALRVEAADVSLDRSIIEAMSGPIVHMVRNAIDHGIETPEERKTANKPLTAVITISAKRIKDRVTIAVADDGKGIDRARLRQKVLGLGMSEERLNSMDDKEFLKLLCMPGLSLKEDITDVSGRGVGMDIVKKTVEELTGALDIESREGHGTRITIMLPRTVTIVKSLFVEIENEPFLVPLSNIVKVVEVKKEDALKDNIVYNNENIPIVELKKALGIKAAGTEDAGPMAVVLIAEHFKSADGSSSRIAIAVNDYGEEVEAYVKPLKPPIASLKGVSGIAMRDDGRPVFVVDVAQIAEGAGR
ncbi:MAG: Hpt domain-containing protein [Deltaproteobacteria bacterium]|nr:Hpt domain-containing protein [Deltaproteobacteria bacterium]